MKLKGTQTAKNLSTAFAGESQARNRYTYFASKARKEGFVQIADVFTETADQDLVNLAQPLADGLRVHVPARGEVESPPVVRGSAIEIPAVGALININIAGQQELEELPGIGPVTAEKIIAFRQANGPFATIEEVTLVSGIGDGKFAQIRDLITVE